jgi:hypothetical protein
MTDTISAAKIATHIFLIFKNLRFGLMMGIKDGILDQNNNIRLRDVMISKPTATFGGVIQYDFGKTVQNDRFVRTDSLNKPPNILLTALANLQAKHIREGHKLSESLSEMMKKYPRIKTRFAHQNTQRD